MKKETHALIENDKWELVPPFGQKKSINCKWVYKVRHNVKGTVNRLKARLVAMAYMQTHGINYEETFSLVAKMATTRMIVALASAKG